MRATLDAGAVRQWCRTGVDQLTRARGEIDRLNVFPVPDGDTGSNLVLTMEAATDAVESADGTPRQGDDLAATVQAMARGALLGARGNSGVILSQLLVGLAGPIASAAPAAPAEAVRLGLSRAADLGYRAVARPIEGTVLSVARAAAEAARSVSGDDLPGVVTSALAGARSALARTPQQLEVLRRAGVVDAGGRGLVVLLDALAAVVTGRPVEQLSSRVGQQPAPLIFDDDRARGPQFEVMYLLDADETAVDGLRDRLAELGDCLVVVGGDGLWNVHVHVDDAGAAVEAGVAAGRPHRIRVTPLLAALSDDLAPAAGQRGVVAVVPGPGLAALFDSVGAEPVQAAPGRRASTSALLEAARRTGAKDVVLLPNDGSTLAVAELAAGQLRDEGRRATVVPTRAPVQGLAAIAVHDVNRRTDEDVVAMTAAARATRHGSVTVAVRDAFTSAGSCRTGDALGLIEDDVVVIAATLVEAASGVVDRMLAGAGELVTLVRGAECDDALSDALREHLRTTRPDVEVVIYEGGQEMYPLLVGVE